MGVRKDSYAIHNNSLRISLLDDYLRPIEYGFSKSINTPLHMSATQLYYYKVCSDDFEIANKKYVDSQTSGLFNNAITTGSDLTLGGELHFPGNCDFSGSGDILTLAGTLLLDTNSDSMGIACTLGIMADGGYDSQIKFYEEATAYWVLGQDQSDSYNFKIATGANLHTSTKVTIARSSGEITLADDILDDGNDPTADAQLTNKQYVDGLAIVKRAVVTLSESDMNGLASTAQTIVSAQGSGKIIIPTSGMLLIDRDSSTAQSSSTSNLYVAYDGTTSLSETIYYIRRFMYNESGDRIWHLQHYTGEVANAITDGENKPLTIGLDNAITLGSIDSMKVIITYHVYDNS